MAITPESPAPNLTQRLNFLQKSDTKNDSLVRFKELILLADYIE